jgi:hypothetical protein
VAFDSAGCAGAEFQLKIQPAVVEEGGVCRFITSLCLTVAVSGAAGCDPGAARPGALEWPGPEDRWRVSFVDPPWEVVSADETLILQIKAEAFGIGFDGAPPTHVFWIGEVDTPQDLLQLVRSRGGSAEVPEGVNVEDVVDSLEIPEHLLDVDLGSPGVVALAELDYVLSLDGALLHRELEMFETDHGQQAYSWQAVIPNGLLVRSFYLPSSAAVVRAGFVSKFDLATTDIDWMAGSIRTDTMGIGR